MKSFVLFIRISMLLILTAACEETIDSADPSTDSGKGGSLARFTIKDHYLYTVDTENLHCFDITKPTHPKYQNKKPVGFEIETIFPRGEHLFLGTQLGMHIMDASTPEDPREISFFRHIVSCDPVVADDRYAYITLSSNNWCGRNTNELQIVNIEDLANPSLVNTYDMTHPQGLGLHRETLYVCDDNLKILDVSNVNQIRKKGSLDISAHDVIPYQEILFVIGDEGIYQYRIRDDGLKKLSEIQISSK